ncbi:MAG TPA: hypothetical protein VG146_03635 [Verrucomicrobiae bacterium]|nr:hypothetical protein [Verrucomicrobiae bacterium]
MNSRKSAINPEAVLERVAPSQQSQYALNVTVVYEDASTRQWARETCERVAGLVGPEAVRTTWWRLNDLSDAAVLAGAVSTALRADIIVVAIRAAEGLPLPFFVWVDSWLPHRGPGTAALVALVTLPERPRIAMERAREYLDAVARKGRFDFLIEERRLPLEKPANSSSPSRQASANTQRFPGPSPQRRGRSERRAKVAATA